MDEKKKKRRREQSLYKQFVNSLQFFLHKVQPIEKQGPADTCLKEPDIVNRTLRFGFQTIASRPKNKIKTG